MRARGYRGGFGGTGKSGEGTRFQFDPYRRGRRGLLVDAPLANSRYARPVVASGLFVCFARTGERRLLEKILFT